MILSIEGGEKKQNDVLLDREEEEEEGRPLAQPFKKPKLKLKR